jgi:hypothetical protein
MNAQMNVQTQQRENVICVWTKDIVDKGHGLDTSEIERIFLVQMSVFRHPFQKEDQLKHLRQQDLLLILDTIRRVQSHSDTLTWL